MNIKNKIEVLRSDKTIKDSLKKIASLSTLNEDIDFDNTKISQLLQKLSLNNTKIDTFIKDKASDNPEETVLRSISLKTVKMKAPNLKNLIDKDYIATIKNNLPLENNYIDPVRGNVIKVEKNDSLYRREFDLEDIQNLKNNSNIILHNSHGEYKDFFLRTEATDNNMITNGFVGKDLSNGATLSFWTIYNQKFDSNQRGYGLITFLGDYCKHYFNEEGANKDEEYTLTNTWLHCTTSLDIDYNEAFKNNYSTVNRLIDNKYYRKKIYRADKNWIHISLSFTNDGVDVYLNGTKVCPFEVKKGKRFGKGKGKYNITDSRYRTPILDFLADENTKLFLGVTLDENKISEAMLFDDITFYDKSIDSEQEAMDIYQEALTINLP